MLADLDLRQLRALVAVADAGSFGRAADALGFTQSAVSQQIAALERAVGDRVFDRPGGPRRVELTPVGSIVLTHARAVLAQLTHAADDLRALRAGEVGRVVVGSFQSISVGVLPSVIGRFRHERPNIAIRCVESDEGDELVERLLDDELDLTFLIDDVPDALDSIEVLVDPFVLVSPAAMAAPEVPASSLAGSPMIGQLPCSCQRRIDAGLRSCGVEPDYVFRTNDNAAVQAMVRAGMGRAILPFLAVDLHDPGVVVTSAAEIVSPRHIHLAWRRERTLSPAVGRFIEVAAGVCAELPVFAAEVATART